MPTKLCDVRTRQNQTNCSVAPQFLRIDFRSHCRRIGNTWRQSACRQRLSGSNGRGASWTAILRYPCARKHKGLRVSVSLRCNWRARRDCGPAPLLGGPVGAVADALRCARIGNVLPRGRAVVDLPTSSGVLNALRVEPVKRKRGPLRGAPFRFTGAPGEIRTPDLLVRSQTLYPTELRARINRQILLAEREGFEPSKGF